MEHTGLVIKVGEGGGLGARVIIAWVASLEAGLCSGVKNRVDFVIDG